jgi:hypothetical protein
MDANTACRVVITVPASVEWLSNIIMPLASEIKWVLDRDKVCYLDVMKDLESQIAHDSNQHFTVTFLDKRNS